MKRSGIFSLISILLLATTLLVNCKKDDPTPLTDQQEAAKKLAVTWGSVQILSSPVTDAVGTLENLELTFTVTENLQPATFTAINAPEYFQTSSISNWSWDGTSSTNKILLSNVIPVQEFTIESLTETTLTISFLFDEPVVNGRQEGIGTYRLSFSRMP